ncbi:MAG: hypothetical protein QNJ11_14155 [Woeseiaceae bacterium]|nr:hypothetical protein [Woeseiaceae bacterium]
MIVAELLVGISAFVILALGVAHLVYTFNGPKLAPRNRAVYSAMNSDSPGISAETTMWKAWVGFNASHSLGAVLFGLVYGYLAWVRSDVLFGSFVLCVTGLAMLSALLVLARRYWFSVPFRAIAVSLLCYVAGLVVAIAG